MATVFRDFYGVIFVDYMEKGKTINEEYYAGLLQRLDKEIKNGRPYLAQNKILFDQIIRTELQIDSTSTVLSRFHPVWIFAIFQVK